MRNLLAELNPQQRSAVTDIDGPVLIFAGAGSGKTRVLTYRVAYLIRKKGVYPGNILAVTFTNKAANELSERVINMIGSSAGLPVVGTFHSICARILRKEIEKIGFTRNFSIYDTADQVDVIKEVMNSISISQDILAPTYVQYFISNLKNKLIKPDDFAKMVDSAKSENILKIYTGYQQKLRENNALDFDDLLMFPLDIFRGNPAILEKYQNRFRYLLVDEYQDTNRAQFELIYMLGQKHRNICVVGDDDQSIYSWRGADITNILNFEEAFPDCAVYKLEQNYRSTQYILSAATAVVRNNKNRADKELWTQSGNGEKITIIEADTDRKEVESVINYIFKEIKNNGKNYGDFVVLYRTNAQSRLFEEGFRQALIPYTIVGGQKFFERKEIKDILAYLRLFVNPRDDISCRRIINVPPRGIGKITLGLLEAFSEEKAISLFESLKYAQEIPLSKKTQNRIQSFLELYSQLNVSRSSLALDDWVKTVMEETGLARKYREGGTEEDLNRLANLEEFLSDISEYCSGTESPSLEDYLQSVSLQADIDHWNEKEQQVTLMTLHSAKGLEFPVVFLVGLEQGLFPIQKNVQNDADLEEERRLFYVGITRAKEKVYISWAERRRHFQDYIYRSKSMFLEELPRKYYETDSSNKTVSEDLFSDYRLKKKETAPDYNYSVGDWVQHNHFGRGQILKVEKSSGDIKYTIQFNGMKKKLIKKYAHLKPAR